MAARSGTSTARSSSGCTTCFQLLSNFHLLTTALQLISLFRTLVREVSHVHEEAVFLIGKGVGGYLASMMMAHDDEDLFKCAAIISPVVDWLRYGKEYFCRNN